MVLFVHGPVTIFAVSQQRMAGVGKGGADLMGAAGEQLRLHQGQLPPGLQGPVQCDGGLATGHGTVIDRHLFFGLIL